MLSTKLRIVGVPDRAYLDRVVRDEIRKLERHCDHLTRCSVAIERPNAHPRSGARYRVRIELHIAGADPVVVRREQANGDLHEDAATIVHEAFAAADRKIIEVSRLQRGGWLTGAHRASAG
jgi:putative sigma-54 modulation protein